MNIYDALGRQVGHVDIAGKGAGNVYADGRQLGHVVIAGKGAFNVYADGRQVGRVDYLGRVYVGGRQVGRVDDVGYICDDGGNRVERAVYMDINIPYHPLYAGGAALLLGLVR